MKLAKYAYIVTLLILTLAMVAAAQDKHTKSVDDPRNTAPTVGTGGPQGGPTGLFTVYDGDTLRKGEYTFSVAYSNYDRDPGNADITSYPGSFQVGVTDNFEAFFSIEGYRAVKINSPRNLSSFYLPNSGLVIGGVRTLGPAIVLAPQGATTTPFTGQAVFRPTGMPFVSFPFTGGNAGTYGFSLPQCSAVAFGFAANCVTPNATLGPPRLGSGNGADLFPGIGSTYGSILPGVVLTTELVACGGVVAAVVNCEKPVSFSNAPSYLADAPYINRTYSTSSINSLTGGFKWRFNNVMKPWSVGMVAYYRYNPDHVDDASSFNALQRGAGAGDNKGDVGVGMFWAGRLAKWANLSANATYLYTTKSKGKFNGASYTMLDTPDELQISVGADFPVNKHFQPILEIRDLHYVGGRTPNAFENNPIDGIAGFRWFPARWLGLGVAYRIHLNQQDSASFKDSSGTTLVTSVCNPGANQCGPLTVTRTFTGVPPGFVTSDNPHGAILQGWIGRRQPREGPKVNGAPSVDSVDISDTTITLGCRPGFHSTSGKCNDNRTVSVSTKASDPENDVLTYNYTVSGGRVVGTGANVQWDLTNAAPGTYTITTGVDDGCGVCGKTDTRTVRVEECPDCVQDCNCNTLSVTGPSGITNSGDSMNFTANVSGGTGSYTYNWSVSQGTITSGQGTPSITVATNKDMAGGSVTATVNLGGTSPGCGCPDNASATGDVAPLPTARLVDEFGPQKDDEVKARVDNFYIQLNNDPSAKGYVVIAGTPAQITKQKAQIMKAVNFRKYDPSRITFVEAPAMGADVHTKFYLVPAGAIPPTN